MPLFSSADTLEKPFLARLQGGRQAITRSDLWTTALSKLRGRLGSDGVERVSTQAVFEYLDVPAFKRTPEMAKRLRRLMVELGWTPIRGRYMTDKGHAARVRGYVRLTEAGNDRQGSPERTG